ncbi:unnamed protein product [Pedinophyceae sp. YPF-701]|nr:unnamed protein product [Pedinophyceae sp. YPF-701]
MAFRSVKSDGTPGHLVFNLARLTRQAENGLVIVGRGSQATMYLNTPRLPQMISRLHAELSVSPDFRVMVRDLGSTNGTFVNDERIENAGQDSESQAVPHESILGFGGPARVSRMGIITENPCRFFVDARPIHVAALAGDLDAITAMVRANPDDANLLGLDGGNLLHMAVIGMSAPVVEFVLTQYPNLITGRTRRAATPLHFAAKYSTTEIVGMLLRAGADPFAETQQGLTAAHIAASRGSRDQLSQLLEVAPGLASMASQNQRLTPLHLAATKGHVDAVRALIACGVDINARTQDGQTALHYAAAENHTGVVECLLGAPGVAVNTADELGLTPLHVSAHRGRAEIARMLLDAGADHGLTVGGASAAQIALACGFTAVADVIHQWVVAHPQGGQGAAGQGGEGEDEEMVSSDSEAGGKGRKRKGAHVSDDAMDQDRVVQFGEECKDVVLQLDESLAGMVSNAERRCAALHAVNAHGASLQELMHAAVAHEKYAVLQTLVDIGLGQKASRRAERPKADARDETMTKISAGECLTARTSCAICMEPMVAPYTVTPCGHTFCGPCILRWVAHNQGAQPQQQQGRPQRPKITCPKCRARVGAMPAPALDLMGILEDVVVKSMDEGELAEWQARRDRWLNDKSSLVSVAEEVMVGAAQMSTGGLPVHLARMRPLAGGMTRPETPALQMSFGGQQLPLADDSFI